MSPAAPATVNVHDIVPVPGPESEQLMRPLLGSVTNVPGVDAVNVDTAGALLEANVSPPENVLNVVHVKGEPDVVPLPENVPLHVLVWPLDNKVRLPQLNVAPTSVGLAQVTVAGVPPIDSVDDGVTGVELVGTPKPPLNPEKAVHLNGEALVPVPLHVAQLLCSPVGVSSEQLNALPNTAGLVQLATALVLDGVTTIWIPFLAFAKVRLVPAAKGVLRPSTSANVLSVK
jgi:hypothetical protein